jgi:thymidylate synthase ThyX
MVKIEGKCGISATVIADSINSKGNRLTTFELVYPRFIHAELMTHRMLSKNAASSRAIPIKRMIEIIEESPAMPVYWGANQAGMQASDELSGWELDRAKTIWESAQVAAIEWVRKLEEIGLHKQISNRITEPWQMMKTVISGTEWANLLWLRDHDAAQPEFRELAKCIHTCFDQSVPQFLFPGQWHLPYVNSTLQGHTGQIFENDLTLEDALKVSASCCAQVSYRRLDDSVEKALALYDRLVGSDRIHASPLEHQGTPMKQPGFQLPPGITHRDVHGNLWSANFRDWIQHRKLILNEAVW